MDREAGLKVVDALDIDSEVVRAAAPRRHRGGKRGDSHRLPRYFYEVPRARRRWTCG